MPSKVRLALGSAALCGLVLLPFVARIASRSPTSHRPRTVLAEPSDAVQLIRRHQFEAAYAVLASDPDSAHGALHQYRLAVCERSLGLADSSYARLLRLEGQVSGLDGYRRLWVGRSLEALADTGAAADTYRDLLADGCSAAVADSARLYLASLHESAGDYDGALSLYRLQRSAGGTTPAVLFRIAEAEGRRGSKSGRRDALMELMERFPAHRLALDAATRLRPTRVEERYARAQVYYRHGDDRRTITDLRHITRNDPGHELAPNAEYTLGRAYARSGQLARARHTYQRLYERHRWASGLYRLAGLEVSGGRDLDAIDTYLDFARTHPQHELADDALWQAAKAAERNDEFSRAGEIYGSLSERFPTSEFAEDASWGVGFSLYCRLRFEDAMAAFQRLSRRARQPHIIDQSLFWAGKSAERLNLADEAEILFTEAASGFPRSYYSSRAVSLGYGRPQLATHTASLRAPVEALDLSGVRSADHVERALLLGQLGLASVAERELRLAERANEGDAAALRVLRDGYELLGLLDRALLLTTTLTESRDREIDRLYPSYYWDQIAAAALDARVDPYLVLSVIRQESYFNENAVSRAGAVGLMQIMPQTGRKLARVLGVRPYDRRALFDPNVSIQLGTRFLGDQVRSFSGGSASGLEFQLGLAAYNAGPRVARRWVERFPLEDPDAFVERIPYRETRLYVKKVLKNYTIYRTLNGASSDA